MLCTSREHWAEWSAQQTWRHKCSFPLREILPRNGIYFYCNSLLVNICSLRGVCRPEVQFWLFRRPTRDCLRRRIEWCLDAILVGIFFFNVYEFTVCSLCFSALYLQHPLDKVRHSWCRLFIHCCSIGAGFRRTYGGAYLTQARNKLAVCAQPQASINNHPWCSLSAHVLCRLPVISTLAKLQVFFGAKCSAMDGGR